MKLSLIVDDFVKRQCVNYKTFYFVVFFSNNSLRGILLESKFWLRPKARCSQIVYVMKIRRFPAAQTPEHEQGSHASQNIFNRHLLCDISL
jgi:hypothetical protein